MGEAKQRKTLDPAYGQPRRPDIMDSDDVFAVFTNIDGDCMPRCLEVAQRLPGSVVQAGQVFFWDNEVYYYDCVFNYHVWVVADGQIYDCYRQLKTVFGAHEFNRLNPARMTARIGTLAHDSGHARSKDKTTDAVYVPGLALSPWITLDPGSTEAIRQTRTNGFVDIEWARAKWRSVTAQHAWLVS